MRSSARKPSPVAAAERWTRTRRHWPRWRTSAYPAAVAPGMRQHVVHQVYKWTSTAGKGAMVSEARAETGGPNRTPRNEIRPAVSSNRKKEPVLLLDLSTSMNWGAADEYGPEWPDPGSRRAIVIEALHGLVRVLEAGGQRGSRRAGQRQ